MKALRTSLAATAAAAVLAVLPLGAHASLALRLSDGSTTVTVVDGGAGDFNGAAGAITFIGSIGAFSLNVSTALGDAATSYMGIHLDSINNSLGAGTLQVAMTESDLNFGTTGTAGFSTSFGGIAGGTIHGRMYVDDANALFGEGANVFDSGVLSSGAFASSGWSQASVTDPFSMTMLVDIAHLQGATTSFNMESRVPEPATMALLGLGLAGLFGTRRRRSSAA